MFFLKIEFLKYRLPIMILMELFLFFVSQWITLTPSFVTGF